MATGPKELVHEQEIVPLLEKILEICNRANISMVAEFELDPREGHDQSVTCNVGILTADASPRMKAFARAMEPEDHNVIRHHERTPGNES